jgi:hypothetical protein
MPTIVAANDSAVLLNGEPVEGVRSIEYRRHQARQNVYALGSAERIAITSGPAGVEGRLTVASTAPKLDQVPSTSSFQITARLRHGDTTVTVAFDDCYLLDKSFALGAGGHGEAVYGFSAARVREVFE